MAEQDTIRAEQLKSATLSREIANDSKEKIKSILGVTPTPANISSSLQIALQLKELAEYFDKSALELEQLLAKTESMDGEIGSL